jgi:NADH-quinone oxidoreductase subunit L
MYIGRLVFLTFFGGPRSEEAERAHESPRIMTLPLVVLAAGAATAGLIGLSPEGRLARVLEPVVGPVPEGSGGLPVPALSGIAVAISVSALALTWLVYASGRIDWMALRVRLGSVQRLLASGWYVDDAYAAILVTPGKAASAFLAYVVDARTIDGVVNGIGSVVRSLAGIGRRVQTGFVRTYALTFLAGAVGLLVYLGFRL